MVRLPDRRCWAHMWAHTAVLTGVEVGKSVGNTERRARDSNPEGVSPGGFQDRIQFSAVVPVSPQSLPPVHNRGMPFPSVSPVFRLSPSSQVTDQGTGPPHRFSIAYRARTTRPTKKPSQETAVAIRSALCFADPQISTHLSMYANKMYCATRPPNTLRTRLTRESFTSQVPRAPLVKLLKKVTIMTTAPVQPH